MRKIPAVGRLTPLISSQNTQIYSFQDQKSFCFKADLWSLGMVIFELCSLQDLRFLDLSSEQKIEINLKSKLKDLEGKYSKTLVSLLSDLLQCNPSHRKELQDIQQELVLQYAAVLKLNKQNKDVQTGPELLDIPKKQAQKEETEAQKAFILVRLFTLSFF